MENNQLHHHKKTNLFFILSGVFIANAIIAELTGGKIFSVEKIIGIQLLNFNFPGEHPFRLNMSVGVVIWPLVFILSDIVNEYFGRKGVKKISILGSLLIMYSFLVIYLGTSAPAAEFWVKLYPFDPNGNVFNINYAYSVVFRQSMGIITGSVCAFLFSQLIDAYSFYFIRKITGSKKIWLRATGSTIISQLFDSFIILFIAFYVMGNWSMKEVVSVGIVQYIYKVLLAITLTPLLYFFHYLIKRYLGADLAHSLSEETLK